MGSEAVRAERGPGCSGCTAAARPGAPAEARAGHEASPPRPGGCGARGGDGGRPRTALPRGERARVTPLQGAATAARRGAGRPLGGRGVSSWQRPLRRSPFRSMARPVTARRLRTRVTPTRAPAAAQIPALPPGARRPRLRARPATPRTASRACVVDPEPTTCSGECGSGAQGTRGP